MGGEQPGNNTVPLTDQRQQNAVGKSIGPQIAEFDADSVLVRHEAVDHVANIDDARRRNRKRLTMASAS
jgi:hypothetical protein